MLISERALQFLGENGIREVKLSLFFNCSIKIKIELHKNKSVKV